ncbi:c-type cytochrome [Aeromonas hydrophila]|uniref:c-type cytochrome n=1 Tax=Aeromonas hydrophila TaxID=644 RepID=UPI00193471D9|nr:cytochrome c [Aeromonas hydrophila]MBM0509948.1 c-type cytochrome [Aeromonas hydrophila]MBW3772935.1 c-type cytochrome [Aeromonas hydrophila]
MIRSLTLTASAVLLALPAFTLQAAPAMSAGEYVAKLGDCAACHTSEASKPLAGGKGFPTPIGAVYATNITPDKTHGIGNYSLPEFIKVMREGITRSGDPLYPAMPYTAYAKMSDEDLTALYHYLMQGVQPQAVANKKSDIPWPLNMRWPLNGWNWVYHDDSRFTPVAGKSEAWNRGAYLVQGAGHCGSCHTPRGLGMQEKALTEADPLYLSGATLDGWYAPNIRGTRYDKQALIDLLKTGRSQHQAVSGPMAEVITHSSQYFSDADLASIATYLTELGDDAAASKGNRAYASAGGKADYAMYCSTCHGVNGQGNDHVIPSLVGNQTVLAEDPSSLLNVLLHGAETPVTQGNIGYHMPGYGWTLNDQQIAELVNTLRASWGNEGVAIKPETVKAQRALHQ